MGNDASLSVTNHENDASLSVKNPGNDASLSGANPGNDASLSVTNPGNDAKSLKTFRLCAIIKGLWKVRHHGTAKGFLQLVEGVADIEGQTVPLGERRHPLRYYKNDETEVEFIVERDDGVIPVEVKAGNGRSQSLDKLLRSDDIPYGIKLTGGNVGVSGKKITFPHYMAMFI